MRIKLHLETSKNSLLPFNYEYAIAAWIYKMLSKVDPVFATWLHDKGYRKDNNYRNFKLLTYSKIYPKKPYKILPKKGIIIETGKATLTLSFLIDKAMQNFVIGVFQSQQLSIRTRFGAIDFKINNIEVLPIPDFQAFMKFRAKTPIFMSKSEVDIKQAIYISPDDDNYKQFILNNLLEKAKVLNIEIPKSLTDFKAITTPKTQLLHLNHIKIRAFLYDFIIVAPPELIRIGYFAGFGGKNSGLGLGFCDVIK